MSGINPDSIFSCTPKCPYITRRTKINSGISVGCPLFHLSRIEQLGSALTKNRQNSARIQNNKYQHNHKIIFVSPGVCEYQKRSSGNKNPNH